MNGHKLKVGVVGVGSLGQWHARIYSEMETAELAGVYDIDARRADEIARKYKTRAFDSIASLAASVDAASIVVPADRHFGVATEMMEHGTHLLVEKPIASTSEQAEQLVRLAEQKKLILQVGHVERFNPVMRFLEDILTAPRFVEAVRLAPYPALRLNAPARGTEVSVVLDLMIHDLEIILHIVRSEVKEIHAIGVPVLSPSEDIANVRLCFVNGCVANVTASRISLKSARKIRVFQENTYVSLDYQNQSGEMYRKTEKGISAENVPISKAQPLEVELNAFVRCVINRSEPPVSGQNAARALHLAVSICERIREGAS